MIKNIYLLVLEFSREMERAKLHTIRNCWAIHIGIMIMYKETLKIKCESDVKSVLRAIIL